MSECPKDRGIIVSGWSDVLCSLEKQEVERVFVAMDADESAAKNLMERCRDKGIPLVWITTETRLGTLCGTAAETAVAAIIR